MIKRVFSIFLKGLAALLLFALAVAALFSVSPVYDFTRPEPFSGPDIFDPYALYVDSLGWKKAAFHVHTKVNGPFNECRFPPEYVDSCYRSFGYDIITFSNHNSLTVHPYDSSLQVNVYEHGYNLYKYHKLVFGADKVMPFDNLLPFMVSHRQFQLDLLRRTADFIQINHPFRTLGTSPDVMSKLTGYEITELDSGVTTEQDYWDWALSSGHYSFALASDDLHYPDRSDRFALRCSFLNCPSAHYEDVRHTLLTGAYYCMRMPDYGNGDWQPKRERNLDLPRIEHIGLHADTVAISLDRPAFIRVYGQGHSVLKESEGEQTSLFYVFSPDDAYARIQAYFPDGEVIYTNPFARYDSSLSQSPYAISPHKVNIPLTALYNLLLLGLVFGAVCGLRKIFARK